MKRENSLFVEQAGKPVHNKLIEDGATSQNDRFLLWADSAIDTLLDFEPGKDAIALTRGLTSSQLSITQANSDTLICLTATGQILATLNNVSGLTQLGY